MKIYPCFDQKLEILLVVDSETFDGKRFKKIEVKCYNYLLTDNGRIKWSKPNELFFIWSELDVDFPLLEVGDIIEGKKLDLDSFPENAFLNR